MVSILSVAVFLVGILHAGSVVSILDFIRAVFGL